MNLRIAGAALALTLAAVVIPSCSSPESLGFGVDAQAPPAFIPSADAGETASDEDASSPALIPMCASAKCAAPFDTCSDSKFLCDIDLSTDAKNCGSCGNACPTDSWRYSTLFAEWKCVGGACQMMCATSQMADCNGRIEDGCETVLGTNHDCSACGDTCPAGAVCLAGKCTSCKPNETLCNNQCVDLQSNGNNCGACGTRCLARPAGFPAPPPQMEYGCQEGTCNHLKCVANWVNCNGDLTDGCEVNVTNDVNNCGACGKKCAAGEACINGACQCNPGPSGCDCLTGFETDVNHCGSCGLKCPNRANSTTKCEFGRCGFTCDAGMADCNLNDADGCETNIYRDPLNCGVCGVACETGQACIEGVCATEPCPDGVLK